MPTGKLRREWNKFFGEISHRYSKFFTNINCAIYMSEAAFEYKQINALKIYKDRIKKGNN
jgi:hypothetical protein